METIYSHDPQTVCGDEILRLWHIPRPAPSGAKKKRSQAQPPAAAHLFGCGGGVAAPSDAHRISLLGLQLLGGLGPWVFEPRGDIPDPYCTGIRHSHVSHHPYL